MLLSILIVGLLAVAVVSTLIFKNAKLRNKLQQNALIAKIINFAQECWKGF